MTATIHSFESLYREHRLPCPCREGMTCYTHRCIDLADILREALDHIGRELLIPADQHEQVLLHALEVLEGITGARPPARGTNPKNHNNPTEGVR